MQGGNCPVSGHCSLSHLAKFKHPTKPRASNFGDRTENTALQPTMPPQCSSWVALSRGRQRPSITSRQTRGGKTLSAFTGTQPGHRLQQNCHQAAESLGSHSFTSSERKEPAPGSSTPSPWQAPALLCLGAGTPLPQARGAEHRRHPAHTGNA